MRAGIETLEQRLGTTFRQRPLLMRALTHKSLVHQISQDRDRVTEDNEQFEFLGDAVLGFLVSEWLVLKFPDSGEGNLSKRKAHLVSAKHLYTVAQRLQIGDYLRLGRGEELSGGREKKALLADAVEALIAALYLDQGIECARDFVDTFVIQDSIDGEVVEGSGDLDFKSALQERAQVMKLPSPKYMIVKQTGPEHAKIFTVEVSVGPKLVSRAEGSSKKSAGQRAAELLLQQLPVDEIRA